MQPNISHMFEFPFEKPSTAIVGAASKKIGFLRHKIEEREARLRRLREEYKITDAVLIDLMEQARKAARQGHAVLQYSTRAMNDAGVADEMSIGAGVVSMLLTETDAITDEKGQIDKLSIIVRNLVDLPDDKGVTRGHRLTFEELRYLGF